MDKHIVVHHAHHPDEGVYRLVLAVATEVIEHVAVNNPGFDPDADPTAEDFDPASSQPQVVEPRTTTVFADPQEIVWADDDPKWLGRPADDIAAEQRQIVSDALTARIAERERAELDERGGVDEFASSLGQEL